MSTLVDRRDLLRMFGGVGAGMLLAACNNPSATPATAAPLTSADRLGGPTLAQATAKPTETIAVATAKPTETLSLARAQNSLSSCVTLIERIGDYPNSVPNPHKKPARDISGKDDDNRIFIKEMVTQGQILVIYDSGHFENLGFREPDVHTDERMYANPRDRVVAIVHGGVKPEGSTNDLATNPTIADRFMVNNGFALTEAQRAEFVDEVVANSVGIRPDLALLEVMEFLREPSGELKRVRQLLPRSKIDERLATRQAVACGTTS